jgi:tetratricopeptide (TPR) repeat protein
VKLFISYSRRDAGDFARHAHKYLVNAGHDAFIDVNSIKIGEPWANSIDNNISDCDIFVVILTPDSLTSKHVEQEVLQAQKQNKIIVPCIHEDVEYSEIKWGLEKLQGIEFSDEFKLTRKLYSKIKNFTNIENEKQNNLLSQQKAIQKTNISEDVDVLLEIGISLYQQGKYHEATEYFDKVLKIEPNNESARYNRFLILQHISKDADALIGKGNTLYDQGKYQEAIECYNNALEIDAKNIQPLINIAKLLKKLNRYNDAISAIDSVLRVDPYNVEAANIKESLMQIYVKKGKNSSKTKLPEKDYVSNRKAIIIGINMYESEGIPRLYGAENDASELTDTLINYGNFEIPDKYYLVGADATRRNILKAVSDIFRKDDKSDLVTFYFSGHGIVDEENNEGYIAPYDYHPDDPFVSGINLYDLKKAMYNARNIANTILILDCCYAGIVTKDRTKAMMAPQPRMIPQEQEMKRNLFAFNIEKMIKSDDQDHGKIVLACTEATAVSREKNNCIHGENDSPHTHGAFSYHLIEGLDGKAANPDTGIISIDSLRKYIEKQMTQIERKQKPMYYVTEGTNIENIKIAISKNKFEAKIKKLIKEITKLIKEEIKEESKEKNFIDLFSLHAATKKVNELILLDPQNEEIPKFKEIIDKSLEMYKEPTFNWLTRNIVVAKRKLNEIRDHLDDELYDLIDRLSFNELSIISESYLTSLDMILTEVNRNTKFETSEDRRLNLFISKFRAIFENEKSHLNK